MFVESNNNKLILTLNTRLKLESIITESNFSPTKKIIIISYMGFTYTACALKKGESV